MKSKQLKVLFSKLNNVCASGLEKAILFSENRLHDEVTIEHLLIKILEQDNTELEQILTYFDIDLDEFWNCIINGLSNLKSNSSSKPVFSYFLILCLEKSVAASVLYYKREYISSISILDALTELSLSYNSNTFANLDFINIDILRDNYLSIILTTEKGICDIGLEKTIKENEVDNDLSSSDSALDKFTENISLKAEKGLIDPVLGRVEEIRLMIDILTRRRKNNPILVGEPGVGKSALVEGLALKVANLQVPDELKNINIRTLDLGLLQAGAGVKGEFEKRINKVIAEVKESIVPIILFIDEAHTLIGAGGEAGMSDAANILKPTLARGELRTIAATTWAEYKKYFERDAALERRFQLVKVEEPSQTNAIKMLTGLKKIYENYHNIRITDDAVEAAVKLSSRYINGRYLPDKAIDLIDTAASRVKINQSNIPKSIEMLDCQIQHNVKRINNLNNDNARGIQVNLLTIESLNKELDNARNERDKIYESWVIESSLCNEISALQELLEDAMMLKSKSKIYKIKSDIKKLRARLSQCQGQLPLTSLEVNSEEISKVISDWTGIPIGNMLKDDLSILLSINNCLGAKIKGQYRALDIISKSLQNAKVGLNNQNSPLGVFLFTGPSGVGKTETARVLSDIFFGGERFLITINMSEYQESHSVSQLKGSPPGYVGYGEGGVLTEAVRKRPYSVVLLDEIEKSHPDVLNMFYQVFERGFMRDGEGREIDFKNTIIIMTSNIGSQILLNNFDISSADGQESKLNINSVIHEELEKHFPVALLARMQVVPFLALSTEIMFSIATNKMIEISSRIKETHGIEILYDENFLNIISSFDSMSMTGARGINAIIENKITPEISKSILGFMLENDMPDICEMSIDDSLNLAMIFSRTVIDNDHVNSSGYTSSTHLNE